MGRSFNYTPVAGAGGTAGALGSGVAGGAHGCAGSSFAGTAGGTTGASVGGGGTTGSAGAPGTAGFCVFGSILKITAFLSEQTSLRVDSERIAGILVCEIACRLKGRSRENTLHQFNQDI